MQMKKYIRKIDGSMIKKITLENSFKTIDKNKFPDDYNIDKIVNIKKLDDIVLEVMVRGYDIIKTDNFIMVTLEVNDSTGSIVAIFGIRDNEELVQLVDNLKINDNILLWGQAIENELLSDKQLFRVKAIKKVF